MIPRPRRVSDIARLRFSKANHFALEDCHDGRCRHRAERRGLVPGGFIARRGPDSAFATAPSTSRCTDAPGAGHSARNLRCFRGLRCAVGRTPDSSFCDQPRPQARARRSRRTDETPPALRRLEAGGAAVRPRPHRQPGGGNAGRAAAQGEAQPAGIDAFAPLDCRGARRFARRPRPPALRLEAGDAADGLRLFRGRDRGTPGLHHPPHPAALPGVGQLPHLAGPRGHAPRLPRGADRTAAEGPAARRRPGRDPRLRPVPGNRAAAAEGL